MGLGDVAEPTRGHKVPCMIQVVIVLLQQCDDQHKIGISWIEVHI